MNSPKTNKFKVGDKVKVVSYQNENQWEKDYGIYVGDIVEILSVNFYNYCVLSKTNKIVSIIEENLELVNKEDDMQEQTPYQEKGYTENSLFKFIGDDGQFELGEVIKLHSDDGDDVPGFKSVTRDRYRYCSLDFDVEYVGEDGCEDMPPHYVEQMKQLTETEQGVKYDSDKLESITEQFESVETPKQMYTPLGVQQNGTHYKIKGIQPIEYTLANDLSFAQGNIVKYVTRHQDKNGLDDLAKSIHYHFFEALRVYGEQGSDELRKKVLELLEFKQGDDK